MKKRKYVKRDYTYMSPVDVYNLVRCGELKKFPNNYLNQGNIKAIVRYVFLVELKFKREDIISKVDHDFMTKHHMGGFRKFFDTKDYKVIKHCFPELDIKAWEFSKVEPGFWECKENQKEFLIWVMQKENINPKSKKDLRRLTAKLLIKYGGSRLLKAEKDLYTILISAIDSTFKEWELMKVGAWDEEKIIQAVKWLVEEKMKYSLEQACSLRIDDFKRYNLDGMLQKGCNHSILYALNLAYGNCFVRDGIKGISLKT